MRATAEQLRRIASYLEELSELTRRLNASVAPQHGDDGLVLEVDNAGPRVSIAWDPDADTYLVDDSPRRVVAARFPDLRAQETS